MDKPKHKLLHSEISLASSFSGGREQRESPALTGIAYVLASGLSFSKTAFLYVRSTTGFHKAGH